MLSLPEEIKEIILLYHSSFSLAVFTRKYLVASKLYLPEYYSNANYMVNLIPYFDLKIKNNILAHASHFCHLSVVKLLLTDPHVNPSDRNNSAIKWASWSGHTSVVKLLLADPRVNPSDLDNDAIRFALWNGHFEVLNLLLADPRFNPTVGNNSAIRRASHNG